MDGLVERLRACGFSINDATRAYAFLFQVVLASIGYGDAPVTGMHRALMTELEAVEAEDLATLREVVVAAAKTSPDAQFEYDLDCRVAWHRGPEWGPARHPAGRPRRRSPPFRRLTSQSYPEVEPSGRDVVLSIDGQATPSCTQDSRQVSRILILSYRHRRGERETESDPSCADTPSCYL